MFTDVIRSHFGSNISVEQFFQSACLKWDSFVQAAQKHFPQHSPWFLFTWGRSHQVSHPPTCPFFSGFYPQRKQSQARLCSLQSSTSSDLLCLQQQKAVSVQYIYCGAPAATGICFTFFLKKKKKKCLCAEKGVFWKWECRTSPGHRGPACWPPHSRSRAWIFNRAGEKHSTLGLPVSWPVAQNTHTTLGMTTQGNTLWMWSTRYTFLESQ